MQYLSNNPAIEPQVTLQIDDFPTFREGKGYIVPQICQYLSKLLKETNYQEHSVVGIPSIRKLSKFFKCSEADILNAMVVLRKYKLKTRFRAFDIPIHVFRISA